MLHTDAARYRAIHFTDDITACDICGRHDLKGTVLMRATDSLGEVEAELHAGVVCAARWQGKTAATIRSEVRETQDAARAAWSAWSAARHEHLFAASQQVLDELGLERSFTALDSVRASEGYQEAVKAWDAAHPEPPLPSY